MDKPAYRAALTADTGTYAASPADVERIFQAHIDRVMPELPRYFSRLPAAPLRIRPLNAEFSGMTYGYYEPPAGDRHRLLPLRHLGSTGSAADGDAADDEVETVVEVFLAVRRWDVGECRVHVGVALRADRIGEPRGGIAASAG